MPLLAPGIAADAYNKPPVTWQSLMYDYWDAANAVAASPLATTKGVVTSTLSVGTVTADGFMLTSEQTIANTSTLINGVVVVVTCTGLQPGNQVHLARRQWSGGWYLGIRMNYATPGPPYYLNTPLLYNTSGGAPSDQDPARALVAGKTGIYATGRDAGLTRTFIVPDDDPTGVYDGVFSGGGAPVDLFFGQFDAAFNLRYKLIGLTSGRPTPEMITGLMATYGVTQHP